MYKPQIPHKVIATSYVDYLLVGLVQGRVLFRAWENPEYIRFVEGFRICVCASR